MVQLPDGGVERIQYTGDVAPRVVLMPVPAMTASALMIADPFAALERVSTVMRQQESAMLRQVHALADAPDGALPGLPTGADGYSLLSTMSGNGVCMRSVRITYNGGAAAPRMVSSTSGDCSPDHGAAVPTQVNRPAPALRPVPNTIEVRAAGQSPDDAPIRQVALNR
jgi:hypothetical protein